MHPVLVKFGIGDTSVSIGSYTFFISLALIGGSAAMWLVLRRRGADRFRATMFVSITALAFPLGARLLYALTHPEIYRQGVVRLLLPTPNHFSLYGGLLASALTAVLAARRLGFPIYRTADAAVPILGGAILSAKLGCFLNGCCPGRASNLPWAVVLPGRAIRIPTEAMFGGLSETIKSTLANPGPTHPIAAYEMLGALAAVGLALVIGHHRRPGFIFSAFIMAFTIARWSIFPLRAGQSQFEAVFYPLLYATIISVTLVVMVKTRRIPGAISMGSRSPIVAEDKFRGNDRERRE